MTASPPPIAPRGQARVERFDFVVVGLLFAQSIGAFYAGLLLAEATVAPDSDLTIAGAVGLFASVWAGYGVAWLCTMLMAPWFMARAARHYARSRRFDAMPVTAGDRRFERVTFALAVAVVVGCALLTGFVLWLLAGDGSLLGALFRFGAAGAVLGLLIPRILRRFSH